MFPVLLAIDGFSLSSFGVFLAAGFIFGVFLVWRLSRAWDLNEEKVLDLTLLTFLGGLVTSRIYFALEHWQFFFPNILNLILVLKNPGFSFWGGFLGGWLSLYFFARKFRIDFWQVADIAAVGFLGGLIFAQIGCFLGGCDIGIVQKGFLSVSMVGAIGSRFPIQIFEAAVLFLILRKIWAKATHFHQRGQIISLTLISIGIVKLLALPWKERAQLEFIFPLILLILGIIIFYKMQPTRTPLSDFKNLGKFVWGLFSNGEVREKVVINIKKSWYNQRVNLVWKVKSLIKLLRRLNVRSSPKNTANY
ncbi:prolipoprotein diacylglyceryl transferase [Candidatus Daviesbacteria bacterium]|nr:prolipoprotein diacylglyceryl transferase [Candidatus Daviesbacteria bacterium]